ncbi:MAG TPA: dicarboxylate/amino acid:cation symporter, partial [Waddliaceae bacterium]
MLLSFWKHNSQSLILLFSITIGSAIGYLAPEAISWLKPIGDLFLNLLFTIVVPLVFFSIGSAIANKNSANRLKTIAWNMLLVFVILSLGATLTMFSAVHIFPSATEMSATLNQTPPTPPSSTGDLIVKAITVSDFFEVLSKKNILALILFSLLFGLAVSSVGEKGETMKNFLNSGQAVSVKVVSYIMLFAPLGLGCYFAYLIGVLGIEFLGSYIKIVSFYYLVALLYFFIGYSFYAFLAGSWTGVKKFWSNIFPPSLTAFATGSSVATIPSNLEAAKKIGIPIDIGEIVIPTATTLHKQGSCLAAILKIALLFGLFDLSFSGWKTSLLAISIAILS